MMTAAVVQVTIIVFFVVLLVRSILQRNMPRVGGKIGPRRSLSEQRPSRMRTCQSLCPFDDPVRSHARRRGVLEFEIILAARHGAAAYLDAKSIGSPVAKPRSRSPLSLPIMSASTPRQH